MASKHTGALMKIITVYTGMPPSNVVIEALEAYIESQLERARREGANSAAEDACEHLHDGPAKAGVVCRSCYDAERNAQGTMEFEALRIINEQNKNRA